MSDLVVQSPGSQPFELVVNPRRFEIEMKNRKAIMDFISQSLEDGHDYGTIPGCDKRVLFQPGAQKICSMVGVYPDYDTITTELENGHREYKTKVLLRHIGSDTIVSQGIGLCSTLEKKYRYRNENEIEETGKAIPKEYWDLIKTDAKKAKELIGGKGYDVKKIDNKWKHVKITRTGTIENPDPADVFNTCLKMSMKRALVQATLTVCGGLTDSFADRDQPIDMEPKGPNVTDQSSEGNIDDKNNIESSSPNIANRTQTVNSIINGAVRRGVANPEAKSTWGQVATDLKLGDINKCTEDAFQEAVMEFTARIEKLLSTN
jgi:hypothetical protein